jgi:queuine tRNA-ribosyltransferase
LHHLFKAKEHLAGRLATIHNLFFLQRLILDIRKSIEEDRFEEFCREFKREYLENSED